MEDEASISLDGKVLGNLRVVDLKHELEKRGLSKSGSKKDLVKRLKQQLEFEKLCEERKGSGDYDLKSELDAATEQNEFVQQYLAQQQKRYAERKEKERIESEALQKINEENLSSDEATVSEEESNSKTEKSPQRNVSEKNDDSNNTKKVFSDSKNNKPSSDILKTTKQNLADQVFQAEETPNDCTKGPNSSHFPTIHKIENSQIVSDNVKSNQTSVIVTLNVHNIEAESKPGEIVVDDTSDSIRKKKHGHEVSCNTSKVTKKPSSTSDKLKRLDSKLKCSSKLESDNCDDVVTKPIEHSKTIETNKSVEAESCLPEITQEKIHLELSETSSSVFTCPQNISDMESSECPSVPYSLSDIQLPESPESCSKSKLSRKDQFSKTESVDSESEQSKHSSNKVKPNGIPMPITNSPHDASESENRETSEGDGTPSKKQKECNLVSKRESKSSRSESSDRESDTNEDKNDRRNSKYGGISSNLTPDSEERPKNSSSKEKKSVKLKHESESENDKSSDSDKRKHHHTESKHKSHDKHRKRSRRSRSQSLSNSSSGASPKHRHSKKKSISKSKSIVENAENIRVSSKHADKKSSRHESSNKSSDSISKTTVSHKKRLKIKRDNVAVEKTAPNVSSVDETPVSRKSIDFEKDTSSSSITSEKVQKQQQSAEPKEKEVSYVKEKDASYVKEKEASYVKEKEASYVKEKEASYVKEKEVSYVPRKVSLSNRKLNRKSSEDATSEAKSKKSKWGSFATAQKSSQNISISSDSLKNWFPDFKLISEPTPTVELETDETSLSAAEDKNTNLILPEAMSGNDFNIKYESTSQMEVEATEPQEPEIEDESEQGPVSKIIFIQNLVRPFTLNQLKELLKQYGKIEEEYFWIDKIKSKCFVMYETEKEAAKARNALNNSRWPSSNPKILVVEFSNEDELEQHKTGNEIPPKATVEPPVAMESEEAPEIRTSHPSDEHKRKDRERRKDRDKSKSQHPVREWDKDKIIQDSPERERAHKEEKSRSSEKKDKKESKKRATDDTPAKLLDDLFQKTKSAPCIYWLPLTEEQAKKGEEERKAKKQEREKRRQQFKEQEEAEHRNRGPRSSRRSREKENRKSSTRSRSPATRRR